MHCNGSCMHIAYTLPRCDSNYYVIQSCITDSVTTKCGQLQVNKIQRVSNSGHRLSLNNRRKPRYEPTFSCYRPPHPYTVKSVPPHYTSSILLEQQISLHCSPRCGERLLLDGFNDYCIRDTTAYRRWMGVQFIGPLLGFHTSC